MLFLFYVILSSLPGSERKLQGELDLFKQNKDTLSEIKMSQSVLLILTGHVVTNIPLGTNVGLPKKKKKKIVLFHS